MKTRIDPAKYKVILPWRHAAGWSGLVGTPTGAKPADVTVQVADLQEIGRHAWAAGAYRVQLTNVPNMRSKTFYGETAWSDATRYASDAATACGDWRWSPDL